MRFKLYRLVRGGRRFPNGTFDTLDAALKAKEHGERWHKANRTSTRFHLEDDDGKPVDEHYEVPEEDDFDEDAAPPEEDPELRIRQLEEENARLQKLVARKGAKGKAAVVEHGDEETV